MFKIELKKEEQEFIIMYKGRTSTTMFLVYFANGVDVVVLLLFKYLYLYIYISMKENR